MRSSVTRLIVIMGVVLAAFVAVTVAPATNDKVTICHVAGLASDPANYITLTIAPAAVFGPGGHFNEDGTPQAGHEQDTMGACNPPPPPPFDQCENIPGDQPEGTDCNPPPPPCTENCTPPPPPPGGEHKCTFVGADKDGGKDKYGGTNDDCAPFPDPPVVVAATPPVPPVVTLTPATPATPVTPPATKPVVKPKPDKPVVVVVKKKNKQSTASTKIVSVKKKKHGVVIIKTADGKTHVGMMGLG